MEGTVICTTCRSGLPIVCYSGPDTDWPVTDAGILGVPLGDRQALAGALENVLSDTALRRALVGRSRQAQEKYFSWAAITGRFAAEIGRILAEEENELTKGTSGSVRIA
jgi:glycosyltransferase involved in cell wall biosynthesis